MDGLMCFTDKKFIKELDDIIKENKLNKNAMYVFGQNIIRMLEDYMWLRFAW